MSTKEEIFKDIQSNLKDAEIMSLVEDLLGLALTETRAIEAIKAWIGNDIGLNDEVTSNLEDQCNEAIRSRDNVPD